MGKVEVMGRLGGPRGWVQEGDVPLFSREANVPIKAPK